MTFRRGDIIEIIYINNEGKLSQRHIQVITQQDNKLLAYCFTIRKMRSFVIKNILAAKRVKAA